VELLRGFALLARTAGLIGQLAEELRRPVGNDIFLSVDLNNRPVLPEPYQPSIDVRGDRHG
jgi:citrate synthase